MYQACLANDLLPRNQNHTSTAFKKLTTQSSLFQLLHYIPSLTRIAHSLSVQSSAHRAVLFASRFTRVAYCAIFLAHRTIAFASRSIGSARYSMLFAQPLKGFEGASIPFNGCL